MGTITMRLCTRTRTGQAAQRPGSLDGLHYRPELAPDSSSPLPHIDPQPAEIHSDLRARSSTRRRRTRRGNAPGRCGWTCHTPEPCPRCCGILRVVCEASARPGDLVNGQRQDDHVAARAALMSRSSGPGVHAKRIAAKPSVDCCATLIAHSTGDRWGTSAKHRRRYPSMFTPMPTLQETHRRNPLRECTWSYAGNTNFPINGQSKRQECVSHSTPEAETVAADVAIRQDGKPALDFWDFFAPAMARC